MMTRKVLLFSLFFVPLTIFASPDISSQLNFFTPQPTDLTLSFLGAFFGSIGNILPGGGSQIIGVLMGIFNACWVIVIGVGILFIVWESVIHAAHSGDMMRGGRGKNSVFKILGIVCGICLVIPSKTTGYSLAQNGVVWIVVQGVGLADRISTSLGNYLKQGGVIFSTTSNWDQDLYALIPPALEILHAEICVAKLNHFKDRQSTGSSAYIGELDPSIPVAPEVPTHHEFGYSKNQDGSITFGSKNTHYDEYDRTSHRYHNECGQVFWGLLDTRNHNSTDPNVIMRNSQRPSQASSSPLMDTGGTFTTPLDQSMASTYFEAALTELILSMQPLAYAIAAVDPKAADKDEIFKNLKLRAGAAISMGVMNYATIIDPLRREKMSGYKRDLLTKLNQLSDMGWVTTPLIISIPSFYDPENIDGISNYIPIVTEPSQISPANSDSILNALTSDELQQLKEAYNRPKEDNYGQIAYDYLLALTRHGGVYGKGLFGGNINPHRISNCTEFEIAAGQCGDINSEYAVDFSSIYQGDRDIYNGVRNWGTDSIMSLMSAILPSDASAIDAGENITCTIYRGAVKVFTLGRVTDTKCNVDFSSANLGVLDASKEAITGAVKGLLDLTFSSLMSILDGTEQDMLAGGMNSQTMIMALKSGPQTGVLVGLAASMIGKNMTNLYNIGFSYGPQTAMVRAIIIGGKMMESAIEAIFKAAQVQSLVGLLSVVGSAMKDIPLIGGATSAITGLVSAGAQVLIPLYLSFCLFFLVGGALLYYFLPMIPVFVFMAVVLNWFVMVFLNILSAPIFCFNLIRDGEGMFGKGERFLSDLFRTALTPAILSVGIVAFSILFNIAFMLIIFFINQVFMLLTATYASAMLNMITYTMLLVCFGIMLLYVAQMLATLCTSNAVTVVGHVIGESIQHLSEHSTHELKAGVSGASQQGGAMLKEVAGKSNIGDAGKAMGKRKKK